MGVNPDIRWTVLTPSAPNVSDPRMLLRPICPVTTRADPALGVSRDDTHEQRLHLHSCWWKHDLGIVLNAMKISDVPKIYSELQRVRLTLVVRSRAESLTGAEFIRLCVTAISSEHVNHRVTVRSVLSYDLERSDRCEKVPQKCAI